MKIIQTKKILKSNKSSLGIIKLESLTQKVFEQNTDLDRFSKAIQKKYQIDEIKYINKVNMEVKKIY
jgi:hypothetical protein